MDEPDPLPVLLVVDEPDPLLVVLLVEPGVQSSMQSPVLALALAAQQVKPVAQALVCEQVGAFAGKPFVVLGSKQP